MELKLFRVIKNVMLLKIVHSEVQPYQQSVSSPCQGVLLYTFQEGHNILEQKRKSELFYNCVHKHSDLLMKV